MARVNLSVRAIFLYFVGVLREFCGTGQVSMVTAGPKGQLMTGIRYTRKGGQRLHYGVRDFRFQSMRVGHQFGKLMFYH